MRAVFNNWIGGNAIGGKRIQNLRYTDDILIIAANESELEVNMERLTRISKSYGLEVKITIQK